MWYLDKKDVIEQNDLHSSFELIRVSRSPTGAGAQDIRSPKKGGTSDPFTTNAR